MDGPQGVDGAAGRPVLLVDLPVRLWDRARQHSAALVREFAFIKAAGQHDTELARRLLEIAATSDTRYANLNPDAEAEVEAALARGDETITVEVGVPVEFKRHIIEGVPSSSKLTNTAAMGRCSLATPEDLRAFWSWYLGEFVRQIDGENPIPAPTAT